MLDDKPDDAGLLVGQDGQPRVAVAALAELAVKDQLAQLAYSAAGSSPDALGKFLLTDTEKWRAVIKAAGITIE